MNSANQSNKRKERRTRTVLAAILPMLATSIAVIASPAASAATTISLGQASNFAVLAGAGISNTGNTSVQGDLGTSPTVSFADTGALILTGSYHFGDAAAIAAKTDLATAYAVAAVSSPATAISTDLGGKTLIPGTYVNSAGIGVTGTLTLDAQGNPNSVFVIQTPLGLNTAAASQINIVNGGQACNVYWQIGTTTNLGANSDFKGNILTTSNFVGGANAKVTGRVLSLSGSVALNANTVVKPTCLTPTTLFVTPDSKTVSYGSKSVAFSAKYQTLINNVAATIGNPSAGNAGWVAPVCTSTPAYTPASPIGTAIISCSGGSGGALYALDRSRTATLTISKTETKINVTSTPKQIASGATVTFSGVVAPKDGAGICTAPLTFAIDRNPVTGVVGAFAVTSPVITTNWVNGSYRLVATYPGDNNCLASTNNSTQINVGVQSVPTTVSVSGAGSYLSPYGKASFNLEIKSILPTATAPAVVSGKIKWGVDKQWKFEGNLNTYTLDNGVGSATGTGILYYSSRTDRKSKWIAATTAPTSVSVKFTPRSTGKDDDHQPMASFAIGFSGTLVSGAPALPVLGPLVTVNKGSH